jgi:RHS repeat-associated protein
VEKTYVYTPNGQLLYEVQTSTLSAASTVTDEETGETYLIPGDSPARYFHYDITGSTIALSNEDNAVIGRISYTPYGEVTSRTGTTDTRFLFCGAYGVQTDVSGLIHMRARYYNPHLCRFINEDPIGFEGGMNFYGYANANPLLFTDPLGLFGWRDGASIGVGFIPLVGSGQSLVELFSGQDYITGEPANRWLAAAGLVAGLLPGGKAALKGGSKVFSSSIQHADELAELSTQIVKRGDGVVYQRLDNFTGQAYVGQAESGTRYAARQLEHAEKLNVDISRLDFDVLGTARAGVERSGRSNADLDFLETSMILRGGGPRHTGGALANQKYPIGFVDDYLDIGNDILWDYQIRLARQTGLANGAAHAAAVGKRN